MIDRERRRRWNRAQQRAYTELRERYPHEYAELLTRHREELDCAGPLRPVSLPKETA